MTVSKCEVVARSRGGAEIGEIETIAVVVMSGVVAVDAAVISVMIDRVMSNKPHAAMSRRAKSSAVTKGLAKMSRAAKPSAKHTIATRSSNGAQPMAWSMEPRAAIAMKVTLTAHVVAAVVAAVAEVEDEADVMIADLTPKARLPTFAKIVMSATSHSPTRSS